MTGILDRERERQQRWADLGLPDPVRVLGEERASQQYVPGFRSPKRAALDAYFTHHPDERPADW